MDRKKFEGRLQQMHLQRQEMERKWNLYAREQEMYELMEAARQASISSIGLGVAGGGALQGDYILTEAMDPILAENGENLIIE